MNFRLEEKISYKNFNIFEFKKWLIANNAKSLYPSRIINSVYLNSISRLNAQKIIMKVLKKDLETKIHALEINIEQ